LWSFGIFFPRFGELYREKSDNPDSTNRKNVNSIIIISLITSFYNYYFGQCKFSQLIHTYTVFTTALQYFPQIYTMAGYERGFSVLVEDAVTTEPRLLGGLTTPLKRQRQIGNP
jgi:uncharacterized membrane protein